MEQQTQNITNESIQGLEGVINQGFDVSMEDGLMYPVSFISHVKKAYSSSIGNVCNILINDISGIRIVDLLQPLADEINFDPLTKNILSGYIKAFNMFSNSLQDTFANYKNHLESTEQLSLGDKQSVLNELKSKTERFGINISSLELMLARDNKSENSDFTSSLKTLNNSVTSFRDNLVLLEYDFSNPTLIGAVSDLCYIRKSPNVKNDALTNQMLNKIVSSMKHSTKLQDEKHETYVVNDVKIPNHPSQKAYMTKMELKIIGADIPTYLMTFQDEKTGKSNLYVANQYGLSTAREYNNNTDLEKDRNEIINFFEKMTPSNKSMGLNAMYEFMDGAISGKYQRPIANSTWQGSALSLPKERIVVFYSPESNVCVTRNGKPESLRVLPDTRPKEVFDHLLITGFYGDGSGLADYISKRTFQ